MAKIRVGLIGLGKRGECLLDQVIAKNKDVVVTALCEVYEDRLKKGVEIVKKNKMPHPKVFCDYRDLIDDEDVDAVAIMTPWDSHVEIAVYAMKAGKAVAMEVGGAYDVKDCWDLVNTYEETKTPFMFLENCCFGRREMMVLNMKEQGVLGKIVHCSGGYQHDLREEIAFGVEERHYRLNNYLRRNCENYPTHDLGPIAKILDINHGNRMVSLTSTASGSFGLHEYIKQNKADDEVLLNASFAQGDIVTTAIKCAGGETIVLTLDTTLPRFYSRGFTVRGTKGMYEEATDSVFIDREEDRKHDFDWKRVNFGNAAEYAEKYEHPVWQEYIKEGVKGSHDGMDYLEFKIFFDCLKNKKPMPVDVYDAAAWMCISALSEQSVAMGGAPVGLPDFTRGKWIYPNK